MEVVLLNVVRDPLVLRGKSRVENASLSYLGGALEANGFDFVVLDNTLEKKTVQGLVKKLPRDKDLLIAAHLMGRNWLNGLLDFLDIVKREAYSIKYTIAGGQYASLYAEEIAAECPEIDLIVRGEGEEQIVRIASWVGTGNDRELAQLDTSVYARVDLHSIPNPHHYSLGHATDVDIVIWSSRGCDGNCSFCMIPEFYSRVGRSWARRPTEKIQREIIDIHERNGSLHFQFGDDCFVSRDEEDMVAVTEMLRSLQTEIPGFTFSIYAKPERVGADLFCRWKAYGLTHVFLGIESFDDRFLAFLGKANRRRDNVESIGILSSLDISYSMGFIMVSPYYSIADIRDELRALSEYVLPSSVTPASLFYALTNTLLVYNKTRLFGKLLKAGLIFEAGYDRFYDIYPYKIDPQVGVYLQVMKKHAGAVQRPITEQKAREALDMAVRLVNELLAVEAADR